MSILQDPGELDAFHRQEDPWQYEGNAEDEKRRQTLLSELPSRRYGRVLDVGCGQGFVTSALPGDRILGIDVSPTAISHAAAKTSERVHFEQASIFDLIHWDRQFDLVVVTGVLYPQYIAQSLPIIYRAIDRVLAIDGVLVCVHIDAWYRARFPYALLKEVFYPYREYTHRLEIYVK